MREPPVRKILYWCDHCDVPLIGRTCGCGAEGRALSLLPPYDVRPALGADMDLIRRLVTGRFGDVPLPQVVLLNKAGGVDRTELVIMHGVSFGWLTFDPVSRTYSFDITPDALPYLIGSATRGVVDLSPAPGNQGPHGRIGGKRVRLTAPAENGTAIVRYRKRYGTGTVRDGYIRVKEVISVGPKIGKDPGWDVAVERNRYHLKNLERSAVRMIRQHMGDRPVANVSFSGGKDSTAVLLLARKAGISSAFFIDTGIEFPETVDFIKSMGVEVVRKGGDFWQAAQKAGPPGKDNRWCCKLLKLHPLKIHLAGIGPCVTMQGNRWYESWNRADLDETSQNPANPLQLNVSPIRNWRALEVFLYLWWQKAPLNPLYEKGIERIGCYLCPSMLESEYEEIHHLHPGPAEKWDTFLKDWAGKKGLPEEYYRWGLWRWRSLPPKMAEVCRVHGIPLNEDHTLKRSAPWGQGPAEEDMVVQKEAEEQEMESGQVEEGGGEDWVMAARKDFPIIGDLINLDYAATSWSPRQVIQAVVEFEERYRANVGRGVHRLTQIADQRYWSAHRKVVRFIGGEEGVLVFTRNATEAINMVARGLTWKRGDRVVTTILEHHSNLLPWRALSSLGVELDVIGINPDYTLDLDALGEAVGPSTRLVAVTHASNVLGVVNPVSRIARIAHAHGALLLVDGAQSVPHIPVDARALGCDFLAFSGHKMLGPTGTGALWMKEPVIAPSCLGGGMVDEVTGNGYRLAEGYRQYEGGTPNIGGGIALGVAADYLAAIGMERVHIHEACLTTRLIDGLARNDKVRVYAAPEPETRIGVVSFTLEGMHPHEVAREIDERAGILLRSGHHCCQPLMDSLGLPDGTVRASLALTTTDEEIDLLIATVNEITRH